MKRIIFAVLATGLLSFGSCYTSRAQTGGTDAPVAQSDQITDPTGQVIQADASNSGKFASVTVNPSTSSNVALQFPASLANRAVNIEPLDGGSVLSSNMIDAGAMCSFSFTVSDQPGVHRVIVVDPNPVNDDSPHIIGMVQFEVPGPSF
jgi:hypothetical protein